MIAYIKILTNQMTLFLCKICISISKKICHMEHRKQERVILMNLYMTHYKIQDYLWGYIKNRIWGGDKLTARYSLKPPNLDAGKRRLTSQSLTCVQKKIFRLKKKGGPARVVLKHKAASLQAGKLDKGPGIVQDIKNNRKEI